uniref:Uncharacterized protein n=1 Tax=Caenorhabditis tropicalis TaxID=1561998 RepID=A0A1I7UVW2_9PELO
MKKKKTEEVKHTKKEKTEGQTIPRDDNIIVKKVFRSSKSTTQQKQKRGEEKRKTGGSKNMTSGISVKNWRSLRKYLDDLGESNEFRLCMI